MNQEAPTLVPAPAPTKRRSRRLGVDGIIDRGQIDWYKDAIIYQLHVKAFFDANNDGVGDFAGLMQKLDYIQDLGVTVIWILPFYPSPQRDDGYDIADYRSVHPQYGKMADFKAFVAEAHKRGLRVVTELVINHTSDQHPWFQRARRAKPGSVARDYYIWSDDDKKWPETRIIFIDTEKSNWTWDDEAKAYFWHRFYSHQPDLNFDNPRVLEEVLSVMRMWLDLGVDGLRLDAIPYLVERDGTNNENLPETHEVIKKIRAALDARYTDRMLLAEANQWPEDTRPYFGDGDECHMGFHFPLMPRMYMALAQEDRHPITDIIRQTPDIPDVCQWAIFLRNHDELTLEMVTEEERDYLWKTYAADKRARINLGIRRRLAPLMDNDRRKIQLLNAFLLSMPGTPILYYGDELGMGDNYFLGDRDGVRTPMQWSTDRNGGFSRANPQALYLPPIMDPIYGFQSINVEAQQADPSSQLNWMRRMLAVRKQHPAFGRGAMNFIYPRNRKILAYIREHDGDAILCVANLSRAAQAVELDLSAYRGRVPVELLGNSPFPPVGDLPYMLTIPAYGFFWFILAEEVEVPRWHETMPEPLPEFITVTFGRGVQKLASALSGRERDLFEKTTLPAFLPLQRWFGQKDARIASAAVADLVPLDDPNHALAIVEIETGEGPSRYFMPLAVHWGEEHLRHGAPKLSYTLAKVRRASKVGGMIDGTHDEALAKSIVEDLKTGAERPSDHGVVRFEGTGAIAEIGELQPPRPLGVEQSNVSVVFGDQLILKLYRRLRAGEQPDVEVARFLTNVAGYEHTPAFLGAANYVPNDGEAPTTLAAAFDFVPNQGDAWGVVKDALHRYIEEELLVADTAEGQAGEETFAFPLGIGELAGRRTAELHRAFATETELEAFRVERLQKRDVQRWCTDAVKEAKQIFARLEKARPDLNPAIAESVDGLLNRQEAILARLKDAAKMTPSGMISRIHGDYHLGQVLVAQNDFVIIDFEGEPARSLEERRAKSSPLRDVAGMLRSFDYAAAAAIAGMLAQEPDEAAAIHRHAFRWRERTATAFLDAYWKTIADAPTVPHDRAFAEALLDLFLMQKALYEIGYELANRPAWLRIPVQGTLDVLDKPRSAKDA